MSDRYCIVVPHYRHERQISRLLPELVASELQILVVDDASGSESLRSLRDCVAQYSSVVLVERAKNGGKGAAVITGLYEASNRSFTHVISLDADGQHDPADVAKLLQLSLAHPDSLFSGKPVFGEDIPASRLYGRMITNGLVRLATASSMIKDAMCGFRVYPLAHVLPLCTRIGYRQRMEFDSEVLVRACWQGLEIRYVDTQVVYPEDGESHFYMLSDNARLVLMHIILLTGGLLRLPGRIWSRISGQSRSKSPRSERPV